MCVQFLRCWFWRMKRHVNPCLVLQDRTSRTKRPYDDLLPLLSTLPNGDWAGDRRAFRHSLERREFRAALRVPAGPAGSVNRNVGWCVKSRGRRTFSFPRVIRARICRVQRTSLAKRFFYACVVAYFGWSGSKRSFPDEFRILRQ